jgi:hypothetical protein
MKIFFGVLFLAAAQTLGVQGWAVRLLSPPVYGEGAGIHHREGLVARHYHHQKDEKAANTSESLNLSTVVGTGVLNVGNSTATALDTLTINPNTISIPTGLVTDTVNPTLSTDSLPRRTVTVTATAIAFVTTAATANQTETSAFVAVATSATGFGGIPGQIAAASAPTAGEVITLAGGQGSFGGVIGAIVVDPSLATSTTTSDTASTSSVATLSAETPVALGGNGEFGGVIGVTSEDASTSITSTIDTVPTTTSYLMISITPVPLRGVGAFGGVVGVQANSVNLISSGTAVVAEPSDTPAAETVAGYKRNTFERAVNIEDGVPSTFLSFAVLTLVNGNDASVTLDLVATPTIAADATPGDVTNPTGTVVIINVTTTVDPVVTVLDTVAPTTASETAASVTTSIDSTVIVLSAAESTTSASPTEEVVTVTATITSTINVPATAPTALPSLTIGDLFPQCANFTGNVSALANLTIPDIVLPSNLTLLQVFNISGESIDCSILLQLLGVNETSTSLRRRAYFGARRTLHRFARGGR